MRRQLRLDLLFVLVIIAAAALVTVAYARKASVCSDRGGTFVIVGRTLAECRRDDGTPIPT